MSDWHFGMDYDMWLYPPVPWDSPDWDFDLPEPIEAANIEGTLLVNAEDAIKQVRSLQAENAKLRELVRDLYCLAYPRVVEWEVSDAAYERYSPCERCEELHGGKSPCASTAKDMAEECCKPIQAVVVADRMRELGVDE